MRLTDSIVPHEYRGTVDTRHNRRDLHFKGRSGIQAIFHQVKTTIIDNSDIRRFHYTEVERDILTLNEKLSLFIFQCGIP